MFVRTGSTWTKQSKLTALDEARVSFFGISVSVDGDTAAVGAGSGSPYVFVRSGTTWTQQQKLAATDGFRGDLFGRSVSIDGDAVLVGAPGDDDNGPTSGSAYLFVRSGTTWSERDKFIASDGEGGDEFGFVQGDRLGWSVSVDGDSSLVAAPLDDDNGTDSGSAYVFIPEPSVI